MQFLFIYILIDLLLAFVEEFAVADGVEIIFCRKEKFEPVLKRLVFLTIKPGQVVTYKANTIKIPNANPIQKLLLFFIVLFFPQAKLSFNLKTSKI